MAKKKLALVTDQRSEEDRAKQAETYQQWREAENEIKLVKDEIGPRVSALRVELERYLAQLEAVPFQITTGDYEPPEAFGDHRRKLRTRRAQSIEPKRDSPTQPRRRNG